MRRIIIDARKLGDGGIGVYVENLLLGFVEPARSGQFELELLVEPWRLSSRKTSDQDADTSAVLERLRGVAKLIAEPAGKYSAAEYLLALKRRRLFHSQALFHAPHYTLPFFFGGRLNGVSAVATVHDTIHVTHPEHKLHRVLGSAMIRSALKRARRVITVSHASRAALTDLLPEAADRIDVVPNAIRRGIGPRPTAEIQAVLERLALPQGALVFVGSDRPHKGFRVLLDAWRSLPGKPGAGGLQTRPALIAVGGRFESARRALSSSGGVPGDLHFVTSVDTHSLACLYSSARAVVVPSLVEGFGLPALEALACSTPLICSPIPSLREVAGECAWYPENLGAAALGDMLSAVLSREPGDTEMRAKCAAGAARAAQHSIEAVAAATLQVYDRCLQ